MALTRAEMTTRVRRFVKITQDQLTLTDAAIAQDLNDVAENLAAERDWPDLEETWEVALAEDAYQVALPEDLRKMYNPPEDAIVLLSGAHSGLLAPLTPKAYDILYVAELEVGTVKGRPTTWMRSGRTLYIGPIANADYTLRIRGQRKLTPMSTNNSECEITGIDWILVAKATACAYAGLGEDQQAAMWEVRAERALSKHEPEIDEIKGFVAPFIAGV